MNIKELENRLIDDYGLGGISASNVDKAFNLRKGTFKNESKEVSYFSPSKGRKKYEAIDIAHWWFRKIGKEL